jgi:hypothetical protein
MTFVRSLVTVAIAMAVALPAAAKDAPALAPSAPWNLHYDDDSCALRRTFGEGNNKVYLELRRFEPGLGLQTVVASSRMKPHNPATFKYRFEHGNPEWKDVRWAPTLNMSNGFSGVIFLGRSAELPQLEKLKDPQETNAYLQTIDWRSLERQFAAQTNRLAIRGAFARPIALDLGPMTEPIAALNKCIDELMTHWNIDVEAHKSLSRQAAPINFREGSRMVDYPPAMLQRSMPGIVNIRLDIDAQGGISGCHIQMPLSDPAFEKSSCADIEHAFEFAPALDKDGKPIPSYL